MVVAYYVSFLEYALTDHPIGFLRDNITTDLHHHVDPGAGVRNDIDKFLSTLEPKTRANTQLPISANSKWLCQDLKVHRIFLAFERHFLDIVKDVDLAEQQRKDIQSQAKCLVTPGGSFDDLVMCLLNDPTSDSAPSEKSYGLTLDEGRRCVKALLKAFGGLQGLSVSFWRNSASFY